MVAFKVIGLNFLYMHIQILTPATCIKIRACYDVPFGNISIEKAKTRKDTNRPSDLQLLSGVLGLESTSNFMDKK